MKQPRRVEFYETWLRSSNTIERAVPIWLIVVSVSLFHVFFVKCCHSSPHTSLHQFDNTFSLCYRHRCSHSQTNSYRMWEQQSTKLCRVDGPKLCWVDGPKWRVANRYRTVVQREFDNCHTSRSVCSSSCCERWLLWLFLICKDRLPKGDWKTWKGNQ